MSLNDKQKVFVAEYIKDFNGTRAYKAAYPSCKDDTARTNASKLLANTNIQAAIKEKADERLNEIDIDTKYIIGNIKEVTERCMQKKPVMVFNKEIGEYKQVEEELFDSEGNPAGTTGVWQFNSQGALKGLELLGKYKSLFTDKVEANVKQTTIKVTIEDDNE